MSRGGGGVTSGGGAPPSQQADHGTRAIPEASVARLAVYLRMLGELAEQGEETVSSEELAAATGVNSAKLRKDLSYIGSHGIRGVGYDVRALRYQLERVLGLDHRQAVALVGVGNLGHALAGYGGFPGRGFPVTALFDIDPDLVGVPINGIPVEHVRCIPVTCPERGITIGMIATSAQAAQTVCDQLVAAGVRSILNFAPVVLQVPRGVEVRKVDLAVELQILAFHVTRRNETLAVNGRTLDGVLT
jgi:redox-sensing transcriptional repressor